MNIIHIDERMKIIDLYDLNQVERTGAYVILDEQITVVETSASPSIPYLKKGLEALNISLEQVKYIILTHIHLDHGGGAGLFLQDCPNAHIVVHPKAARHIIDPTKLELGAKEVYKKKFDELFNPIIPVPKERVMIKEDNGTLQIGKDTYLRFHDTPGHANHHFSIYDPVSNGMFTGDTAGIYYWMLKDQGIDFFLPSTSPNQFNPEAMKQSIDFYRKQALNYLYFGHFGFTSKVNQALDDVEKWIDIFVDSGRDGYLSSNNDQQRIEKTFMNLQHIVFESLINQGVPKDHSIFSILELDLKVSAMGLIDFWNKSSDF
ncbi:MBL fold metallo-hydrolase [Heyndrickxia sp. NPDC080065]|uniref:MBL fold metallo-hydrolase n=1 Tax=Heyndrickxia sp. NPDC080065 TaxID=3390568 RepID=UPI003CFEE4E6